MLAGAVFDICNTTSFYRTEYLVGLFVRFEQFGVPRGFFDDAITGLHKFLAPNDLCDEQCGDKLTTVTLHVDIRPA